MTASTILTLANGRGIDLLDPRASDYADWDWSAEHLAKEKRFNGATPNAEYSVAEHLCRGADAILKEIGDEKVAAYFSVHDTHESALKDITTPLKEALAHTAKQRFGVLAATILGAFNALTEKHDQAIHEAAGLPFPLSTDMRNQVKYWDLRMFVTEWRDLMGDIEHPNWAPYRGIQPLTEAIRPWPWQVAKTGLLRRWKKLLPALRKEAA